MSELGLYDISSVVQVFTPGANNLDLSKCYYYFYWKKFSGALVNESKMRIIDPEIFFINNKKFE